MKQAQCLLAAVYRVENQAGQYRADRMEPKFERHNDPEIRAGAANTPEQIRVFDAARGHQPAVGGDDFDRHQITAGEPVFAVEPAVSAPSVSPAIPVSLATPEVVASPKACAA